MEKQSTNEGGYLAAIKKICTTRNFLLMMIIRAVYSIAIDLSETIVNSFGDSLGASAALLGVLASIMSMMKFVGRPVAGRFVDAFKKPKVCLIVSIGLFALVHGMYMVTNNVVMFAVSKTLYGFVNVFSTVAISAVVAAVAGRKALGTALGVFAFVPKLVRSVAPMISVWMDAQFGPKSVFVGTILLMCICMLVATQLDTSSISMGKKKSASEKKSFSIHNYIAFDALAVCGIRFFSSFMFVLTKTYLVIYGKEAGFANAAVYFTMYSLSSMWGGLVGGPLYDKKGIDYVMYPMLIGSGAATLLIGFGDSSWYCMAAGIIFGFTYGMSNPACSAAAQKSVMPDKRGIASATNLLVPDICSVVTGIVIGVMANAWGYAGTFRGMVVFPAVGIVVYTLIRGRIKEHAAKVEAEIAAAVARDEAANA